MSGGSRTHAVIGTNIVIELGRQLYASPGLLVSYRLQERRETVRLISLGIDLPLSELHLKIDFTPGS